MKKELDHLHKKVRNLEIALALTQVTIIILFIIWGYQYLQLLQNYRSILHQMKICLESVKEFYVVLQQIL